MKLTPVLIVDDVEKSLTFWVDRLGFIKQVEVPEGDRLGFVILVRDGIELMLQSVSSVRNDTPQFVSEASGSRVTLFFEVDDFAETLRQLSGYPVALAERTTDYGMREIGVFEPGGHPVIFAARQL